MQVFPDPKTFSVTVETRQRDTSAPFTDHTVRVTMHQLSFSHADVVRDAVAQCRAAGFETRFIKGVKKMETFNFSANGLDFGDCSGVNQAAAQEVFAIDSGYESWAAMVEQAEEFGGNNVEVKKCSAI